MTHRYFELVIMVLILVSPIALALDTPYPDPESSLASWLGRLDTFFLVVFTLEMLLKMLAFGFFAPPDGFFLPGWNLMDGYAR